MSRRKIRTVAAVAIIGGFIVVGAVNSFAAAPLSETAANSQGGAASAAGVPGTLTVSESTAAPGTASWSAVSVAGTSVIGRDSANHWSGTASAAGDLIDTLNAQTCGPDGGPLVSVGLFTCVNLLPSGASGSPVQSIAGGQIADVTAFYTDGTDTYGAGLVVLPSAASRVGCTNDANAAILVGVLATGSGTTLIPLGLQNDRYSNCAA